MKTEHLELLFVALAVLALVSALGLMVCCVWRSWGEQARGPVYPGHWPEAPEEKDCQRALWARFKAERKLKQLERCRSELGERLQVNGAVRRI